MAVNPSSINVNSTGSTPVDVAVVTTSSGTVDRQVFALGDPSAGSSYATVSASTPTGTESGLFVRHVGALTVVGANATGTAIGSNPLSVSGVDPGGLVRSLLTDTTGRLRVLSYVDTVTSVTGTVNSAGGAVTMAVPVGVSSVKIFISGNAASAAYFQLSPDGGTTWYNQIGSFAPNAAATASKPTNNINPFNDGGGIAHVDVASATHVRIYALSLTSNSFTATISAIYGSNTAPINPSLPGGTNNIGNVGFSSNATVVGAAASAAAPSGNPVYVAGWDGASVRPILTTSTGIVSVTAAITTFPAITKGTQGTTGVSTQDLKDSGRNVTNYFTSLPILSTSTETLLSLTGYKTNAAVAATTTPAVVTAAKKYRIQSMTLTYIGIATASAALVNIRVNTAGTVLISSPLIFSTVVGGPAAAAGVAQSVQLDFPDGFELAAASGFGVSIQGLSSTMTAASSGYVSVSILGFEY